MQVLSKKASAKQQKKAVTKIQAFIRGHLQVSIIKINVLTDTHRENDTKIYARKGTKPLDTFREFGRDTE